MKATTLIGKKVTHSQYPKNIVWTIMEYNRETGSMKLKNGSETIDTHASRCKAITN